MIAPAKQLLEMSSMYKGQLLEVKDPEEYIDDSERSDFIWKVCCAICYDVKLQQHMLSETSFSSLMEICKIKINEILLKLEEE